MPRKRVVRIPSSATIKCPLCSKNFRIKLQEDIFLGNLECKKCKTKIETPQSHCCVICAFSKKKCPQSLIMEAKMKGLEIKYEKKDNIKDSMENKPILLIDEKIINDHHFSDNK